MLYVCDCHSALDAKSILKVLILAWKGVKKELLF